MPVKRTIKRGSLVEVITPPVIPVLTQAPALSGIVTQGQTLTVVNASWANGPITDRDHQIYTSDSGTDNWSALSGELGPTYIQVLGDIGHFLRVGEIATNAEGVSVEQFSEAVGPILAALNIAKTGQPTELTAGDSFDWTPVITGGRSPYAVTNTGDALPAGWTIAPATGRITSVPTDTPSTVSGAILEVTDADGLTDTVALDDIVIEAAVEYPVSIEAASLQAVYDLRLAGATGFTTTPTKVPGVTANMTGMSIAGAVITLGSPAGIFEGWDVTAHEVWTSVDGWVIRQNKFHATGAVTYAIRANTNDVEITRNTFDGEWGLAGVAIRDSGARTHIHLNKVFGYKGDWIKYQAVFYGANRGIVENNDIGIGGWNNPESHCDPISISAGEPLVQQNYMDLQGYIDPLNDPFTPPRPKNTSTDGYTYGLTNAFRMSASVAAIGTPEFLDNVVLGYKRAGYYFTELNASANGITGARFDGNVLEQGASNGLVNGTISGTIDWETNYRWSDGQVYSDHLGNTPVAPTAPVLDSVDSITDTQVRLIFDRGGDSDSHQYALSASGGAFGAWTTLNQATGVITGLTPETEYDIKLRAVNTHGNSAESGTVGWTSLEDETPPAPSGFVVADNQATAWSRATTPFAGITSARRMQVAWKQRQMSDYVSGTRTLAYASGNYLLQQVSAATLRFRLVASTTLQWSFGKPGVTGASEIHLITVDLTVAGTDSTGTAGDVGKHYVLTDETTYELTTATGVALTDGGSGPGTRTFNPSTAFPVLELLARGSSPGPDQLHDMGLEWFAVKFGDNTMTLDAPANAPAMTALFGDAAAVDTLDGWHVFWGTDAGGGVTGWNGSLANRGTQVSEPMVAIVTGYVEV